ncbi:MAG: hypothetical protein IGS03_06675 [Candidatus Sericytochromatia bacterium]|nr:hypothetical protein [Candidatus Sericytochromatia bacterium]
MVEEKPFRKELLPMMFRLKRKLILLCCLLALFLVSAPAPYIATPGGPPLPPIHFYAASVHTQRWLASVQDALKATEAEALDENMSAEEMAASLLKTQCERENDALASQMMQLHRYVFMEISGAISQQQVFAPETQNFLVLHQLLMRIHQLIRSLAPEEGLALARALLQFLTETDPRQLSARMLQQWLRENLSLHAADINRETRQGLQIYNEYNADQREVYLELGQTPSLFVLQDIPRLQGELITMMTWVEENYLWLYSHWGEASARAGHDKMQKAYRAMTLRYD